MVLLWKLMYLHNLIINVVTRFDEQFMNLHNQFVNLISFRLHSFFLSLIKSRQEFSAIESIICWRACTYRCINHKFTRPYRSGMLIQLFSKWYKMCTFAAFIHRVILFQCKAIHTVYYTPLMKKETILSYWVCNKCVNFGLCDWLKLRILFWSYLTSVSIKRWFFEIN